MKHELSEIELQERAFLSAMGALPAEEQLAFENHLAEGCDYCQAELSAQQEICAQLAFAAPAAEPSASVKDRIFERISSEKQADKFKSDAQFFTLFASEGAWQKLTEGVFFKRLYVDREKKTVTSLYKMQPGAKVPTHRHSGVEECFVIEGDFHLDGLKLGPGDYHRAEAGSLHQTLHTENGNLLLIIAPQD
jgi:quercetin dioxygenase-like cupin family protein